MSGIAVAPTGNIVTLNRGYHPVLEFKSDGTFVRSWGEGSRMFDGAHNVRFDPQGEAAERFKIQGMPTSVIIDRRGVVRFTHIGFRPVDRAIYESELRELLAGK